MLNTKFNTKLTVLGRQVELPVELVSEYKKIFGTVGEDDFISDIEDMTKYRCPNYHDCSNQQFNAVVSEAIRDAIANNSDPEDKEFLGDLLEELKAEGEI